MSKISIKFAPFYPYGIIKAIFNRLNLLLSQKSDSQDTFLNKLCSKLLLCQLRRTKINDIRMAKKKDFVDSEIIL